MTVIKTEALVLKSIPFKETSNIVRLYTKKHGKVSIIAKGARRLKSPFRGYLEPLSYVEVIYYHKPTREIQILSKIEFIKAFFQNSPEITEIAYAMAVMECVDKFIHEHQKDEGIFLLVTNVMKFMDSNRDFVKEAFIYFLLEIATMLGYKINFNTCSICKQPLRSSLYEPSTGRIICKRCTDFQERVLLLRDEILDYMRILEKADLEAGLPKFQLAKPGIDVIDFLVSYISYHLDFPVKLKSLEILANLEFNIEEK